MPVIPEISDDMRPPIARPVKKKKDPVEKGGKPPSEAASRMRYWLKMAGIAIIVVILIVIIYQVAVYVYVGNKTPEVAAITHAVMQKPPEPSPLSAPPPRAEVKDVSDEVLRQYIRNKPTEATKSVRFAAQEQMSAIKETMQPTVEIPAPAQIEPVEDEDRESLVQQLMDDKERELEEHQSGIGGSVANKPITCSFIMTRGKRKGAECGSDVLSGDRCSNHFGK